MSFTSPLILAKAGIQFFGFSDRPGLHNDKPQASCFTKALDPRFREDERNQE